MIPAVYNHRDCSFLLQNAMAYVFGSTFVCQSIDAAKEVLKSLVAFCAFYIVVEDFFF